MQALFTCLKEADKLDLSADMADGVSALWLGSYSPLQNFQIRQAPELDSRLQNLLLLKVHG